MSVWVRKTRPIDTLGLRLRQLVTTYWQVPEPEATALWRALRSSPCSRVTALRHHLTLAESFYPTTQGQRPMDLSHTFSQVLTPQYLMQVVRDLRSAGSLSAQQVVTIEEAMLACTSDVGAWKAIGPP